MDVCVCLFCVCVVLCLGSSLATGWSPVQGDLLIVYILRNWKEVVKLQKGCTAIEKNKWLYVLILSLWQERYRTINFSNSRPTTFQNPYALRMAWLLCCYRGTVGFSPFQFPPTPPPRFLCSVVCSAFRLITWSSPSSSEQLLPPLSYLIFRRRIAAIVPVSLVVFPMPLGQTGVSKL
jgi:hypothetical protein